MDDLKEIAKAFGEVPGLLKEVYGDLAKPGVSQVGKALSTVLGLGNTLLWPVALANEKAKVSLERNLEKYRKRMEQVSDDRVSEVPPELGVPIAEKLSYVSNEELSDMYVELLAKASTFETNSFAHPSFVGAINNLSPDEAILLKALRSVSDIPYVEVRLKKKDKNEWATLNNMYTPLASTEGLAFPKNIVAYISNFEGLGIIQVRHDIFIVGNDVYEPLEKECRQSYEPMVSTIEGRELTFQRGKIEITPYGRLFLSACFAGNEA